MQHEVVKIGKYIVGLIHPIKSNTSYAEFKELPSARSIFFFLAFEAQNRFSRILFLIACIRTLMKRFKEQRPLQDPVKETSHTFRL